MRLTSELLSHTTIQQKPMRMWPFETQDAAAPWLGTRLRACFELRRPSPAPHRGMFRAGPRGLYSVKALLQ
jgi:hypothetical protein